MTDITRPKVATTEVAAIKNPVARSTTRRMAREPKECGHAPGDRQKPEAQSASASEAQKSRGPSKIAMVVALLEGPDGATLPEMVESTGWLPHTTRAALTGLKKKGHAITKDKRGEVTCYHLGKAD